MVGNKRTKGKNSVLYLVTTLVMLLMTVSFCLSCFALVCCLGSSRSKNYPDHFCSYVLGRGCFGDFCHFSRCFLGSGAFVNTTIVATIATFLMMVFALMVGYAFSKIEFKGKKFVNHFILFQMFFPAISLVPNFNGDQRVGLLDSRAWNDHSDCN